jgi:hypothetical protein
MVKNEKRTIIGDYNYTIYSIIEENMFFGTEGSILDTVCGMEYFGHRVRFFDFFYIKCDFSRFPITICPYCT